MPSINCRDEHGTLNCGACCQRIGRVPVPGFSRDRHGQPCPEYDPLTKACRIYDTRPAICRDFMPGSEGCLVELRIAGVIR